MNRLFNLKSGIILFAILICQAELKAQSVSKSDTSHNPAATIDTNQTKKAGSSIVVKSDTALIVKAGATIVQKADTTMVINADPELIRKFNEIVAAKQTAENKAKADSASKQNAFTQVRTNTPPATTPDNSASTPASSTVPVSVVPNPGSTASSAITGAATSAVTGAAKTDAHIPSQTNSTNSASPANNNTQPVNNTNNQVTNTTPANKPDPASSQPAKNNTAQQTATNTNGNTQQSKPDSASAANNNNTQQPAASSNPVAKPDSALATGSDTTTAKKDTTLKSDTSKMKKDTSLMVTDTTQHIVKAVAAYLEVGGAGLAISGNYDSRFHDQRDGWGYRIGAGYFASGGNTVFTVPFQINYLTGEHSMHIELGAGTTFLNSTGTNIGNSKWEFDKITGFIATATVGFRYQPEHKGLNFRIAFVPILYDEGLIPAGGVSIGYTFK